MSGLFWDFFLAFLSLIESKILEQASKGLQKIPGTVIYFTVT